MFFSDSVFSDDYYFIAGVNALIPQELIEENYYIIDVETINLFRIKRRLSPHKKVIAFISDDFDYYVLNHLKDIVFINKN